MSALAAVVAERARRLGSLRYDELLELALYHPDLGFYAGGAGAGRGGADFLTSPEVGPLFGAVIARALDAWWDEQGRPDPYVVVEAGAGSGALAASALAAAPACSTAMRYVLVERSAAWRERHARRLPVEPAGMVLGPGVVGADEPELGVQAQAGIGPLVTSLAELPVGPFEGVVLANELLDNLPFRLLERAGDGSWSEVRVTPSGEDAGRLVELLVAAPPEVAEEAQRLAPLAEAGARIPLQHQARDWLRAALGCASRVVVVDYADTTPSMAGRPWTEWVRTYRDHGRGGAPLDDLGGQDVTCDVAVDQLAAARVPSADRSQAEFLEAHGIGALADAARAEWQARAPVGDLAALQARSRVTEAAALTDPHGLGRFRVLEWNANVRGIGRDGRGG